MEIGRASSPAAERMSQELRGQASETLARRRHTVASSLVASASMGLLMPAVVPETRRAWTALRTRS